MTDLTATQRLLRTTPTDTPRQMSTYLQTLAEQVDRRMATQAYNQRRSKRRPFAMLEVGTEVAYDASAFPDEVSFDTISEDTAGLADLSLDPHVINLAVTGWWCVGGYAHTTGFGSAASDTQVTINVSGGLFVAGSVRDGAIGLAAVGASFLARVPTPGTYQAKMNISWNGGSTTSVTTLRYAQMWAWKVRDL